MGVTLSVHASSVGITSNVHASSVGITLNVIRIFESVEHRESTPCGAEIVYAQHVQSYGAIWKFEDGLLFILNMQDVCGQ